MPGKERCGALTFANVLWIARVALLGTNGVVADGILSAIESRVLGGTAEFTPSEGDDVDCVDSFCLIQPTSRAVAHIN